MLHKDRGYQILEELAASLEDLAKVERNSKMTGRRMTILLVPRAS